MASKIDILSQIKKVIGNGGDFVLSGGAGSGKTRSLTEVISFIQENYKGSKIACITFTNVAADEIASRVLNENEELYVCTIHDFLWNVIKGYQKDLKSVLIQLLKDGKINYSGDEQLNEEWFKYKNIDYRQWRNLKDGVISHGEVILLAYKMFEHYQLLRKILTDSYDFILIDEYQDTEKNVIEIFIDHYKNDSNKPIIGLFGDSMQSIYGKGIRSVNEYISDGDLTEIKKNDNWRSSDSVISLINKIRDDGLEQKSSGRNQPGSIKFIYSDEILSVDDLKKNQIFSSFNFSDHLENKELYLTHKLIAKELGFENLLSSYKYRDNLTSDRPDKFIKHLEKIEEIRSLYNLGNFNQFLKKTDFKIKTNKDLVELKNNIDKFGQISVEKIEDAINLAHKLDLVKKDDSLEKFIISQGEQYDKSKDLQYLEFINFYKYKYQNSPYSTQHGVKGAEYDNVFIILDNGRWNQYNFTYLFENREDKQSILDRTRKIFYVCCSRAKKNLIVYFNKPSTSVINQAKIWFGEKNVVNIKL